MYDYMDIYMFYFVQDVLILNFGIIMYFVKVKFN